ncbi:protein O-linked-mannose beta-1,2-N-acetylglucosaminyltransferase 1-like [Oratosquilla oratoria]|uniref:protein O-linked-mannose beta-1,2-N-acetylglucosaminyltransferase 1-like n=1 Tax=Oratosquilla oratoria TaxID=337810 RepID=UPI003F764A5D
MFSHAPFYKIEEPPTFAYKESSSVLRKIFEDNSMIALGPEDIVPSADYIELEMVITRTSIEVKVDGREVSDTLFSLLLRHLLHFFSFLLLQEVSILNAGVPDFLGHDFAHWHSGVHVLVLDQNSSRVLLKRHFMTWQPKATDALVKTLGDISSGKLLLLVAPGDWKMFFNEKGDRALESLGSFFGPDICVGEMWALVATTGGPVWGEGTTIKGNYSAKSSSTIRLDVKVPRAVATKDCWWYSSPGMEARADFCKRYEGYGSFCDCAEPESLTPDDAPDLEMKEEIPIVIVTARSQTNVLRQLRQLWRQAGGRTTPILLSVDGALEEARHFARAVGLPVVFHRNMAPVGSAHRINEHIKFSILQAMQRFPHADKVIVLEDDLILAPDFIRYFHQTAPLLDEDDSIFCVNAFSYNSFAPWATNTSRLYRNTILPAYGWMIDRKRALFVLPRWVVLYEMSDWDWWTLGIVLKGRMIITPEVSRTMHGGGGGVHVSGWEQALYFDRRPLNTDPDATVDISYLTSDKYAKYIEDEIRSATVLVFDEHPCKKEYVPKHKVGSFVFYYEIENHKDTNDTYFVVVGCLGGYEKGRMENYKFLHAFGYYNNTIYGIACPLSPYCKDLSEEEYNKVVYRATVEDVKIARERMIAIGKPILKTYAHIRIKPIDEYDEIQLTNYMIFS